MEKAKNAKKYSLAKGKPLAHGVGRRKRAVARVWLRRGKGILIVNGRPYEDYFDTQVTRLDAIMPLKLAAVEDKYDVGANVVGGGLRSQAGAIRLGISRALVLFNEDLRMMLRKHSLLTVDARKKERKKYGQKGARRKFQFTKR